MVLKKKIRFNKRSTAYSTFPSGFFVKIVLWSAESHFHSSKTLVNFNVVIIRSAEK